MRILVVGIGVALGHKVVSCVMKILVTKPVCGSQVAFADQPYLAASAREDDTVASFIVMRDEQMVITHYNQPLTYSVAQTV